MQKKLSLLFIFAFFTSLVSAQEKSVLQIHFFPLTALEIDGGIRAGAELFLSEKISIMADYNHILSVLDKKKSSNNLQGFALRIEPKYFLKPEKSYISLQLLYKSKNWELRNDSIMPEME